MWFIVAVFIAGAPLLWSYWCEGLLPLIDYPQHVSIVSAVASCDPQRLDGACRFLTRDLHIAPYATFYSLAALLVWVGFSADTACRILLSIAVLGVPFAVALLLRTQKRPVWPALFALTIGHGDPLHLGFLPFLLSISIFVLVLVAIERLLAAPSIQRQLVLAGAASVLFLTHALPYQVAILVAFWLWVSHPARSRWQGIQLLLALLPSLGLHFYWIYRDLGNFDIVNSGQGLAQIEGPIPAPRGWSIPELRLRNKWYAVPRLLFAGMRDPRAWYVVGIATFVCELLFAGWWHFRRERLSWFEQREWRFFAIPVLVLLLYFLLPVSIASIWNVAPRTFVLLGCLLGLAVPVWGAQWRWRWLGILPYLLFTIVVGLDQRQKFVQFQSEVPGLQSALRALPPGQRVYPLIFRAEAVALIGARRLQLGGYVTPWGQGVSGCNFFHNAALPVHFRYTAPLLHMGELSGWSPHEFNPNLYGPFYDAVLVHWPSNTPPPAPTRWGWPQIIREGSWLLLRSPHAYPGVAVDSFRENPRRLSFRIEASAQTTHCIHSEFRRWTCGPTGQARVEIAEDFIADQHLPCIRLPAVPDGITSLRFTRAEALGDAIHGYVGNIGADPANAHAPDSELSFWQGADRVGGATVGRGPVQNFSFSLPHPRSRDALSVQILWRGAAPGKLCFNAFVYDSRL